MDPGTSLFTAARRAGRIVGSACDAEGICGRCGLRPLVGAELLSPEGPAEQQVKQDNGIDPALRLSCVTQVLAGPVVVTADYW